MNADTLKKYQKWPLPKLLKKAAKHFNAFIRDRDKAKTCISCPGKVDHAGHYYSAGHYPALRFNEVNTNGQDIGCNTFKHGNLIEYRKGLIRRYGEAEVAKLDMIAETYKRDGFKWDRFSVIEIIEKYKQYK